MLLEVHYGVVGGYYVGDATDMKIWQSDLWWLTVLKDAVKYSRECGLCQRMYELMEKARMPH